MLGAQLVVVADAHIRGDAVEETDRFLAFLDRVPVLGDCLLINGDLFEFWFAYRRAIPRRGFAVAAALASLRRKIPVLMTGGNHDRWGYSFWADDAGIEYAADELRLAAAGRRILATHGDALPSETRSAGLVHSVITHPVTASVFGAIHPTVGLWLVERLGGHLSDATSDPTMVTRAQARQAAWAARRRAVDPTIDMVIMAHTHRAESAPLAGGGHYLNPGAWVEGRHYAVVTPTAIELHTFQ